MLNASTATAQDQSCRIPPLSDLPLSVLKKGLNRLSLRFIYQVWMGESVLLREGIEGDDGFSLHVGQSLVIATGETTKDDLLHRFCMLRLMILTERVVIFRAIDERDVFSLYPGYRPNERKGPSSRAHQSMPDRLSYDEIDGMKLDARYTNALRIGERKSPG